MDEIVERWVKRGNLITSDEGEQWRFNTETGVWEVVLQEEEK